MATLRFTLDGTAVETDAPGDTPLLYVLRDRFGLDNPRFGCGLAQCGACTVHLDGAPLRSCVTPVSVVAGHAVTTLRGLGTPDNPHPVQQAFIDEQVPQCGYCTNGWVMTAAALVAQQPRPTDAQLKAGLAGLQCRCGTHYSLLKAVRRARDAMP
ncbi:MAG: Nicotinate dehydrogenase subunit [Pseudomonadota bacterium]|jgi:aerobic-type carbon monoxide dehydrogenase small subunit (CoxS/CutS family)